MRMLGKVRSSWCSVCNAVPGPDCPDVGRTTRQVRAEEKRVLSIYVDNVWWGDIDEEVWEGRREE